MILSYIKIAAYITAYQDDTALNACVQSLQDQSLVNEIYIVDNSPQPLSLPPSIIPIIYYHYPQNIGLPTQGGIKWTGRSAETLAGCDRLCVGVFALS